MHLRLVPPLVDIALFETPLPVENSLACASFFSYDFHSCHTATTSVGHCCGLLVSSYPGWVGTDTAFGNGIEHVNKARFQSIQMGFGKQEPRTVFKT